MANNSTIIFLNLMDWYDIKLFHWKTIWMQTPFFAFVCKNKRVTKNLSLSNGQLMCMGYKEKLFSACFPE